MQQRHELSRLFGDMADSASAALKADIAQHGLTDPGVHTYEDKVLDGWHRYRAAQESVSPTRCNSSPTRARTRLTT